MDVCFRMCGNRLENMWGNMFGHIREKICGKKHAEHIFEKHMGKMDQMVNEQLQSDKSFHATRFIAMVLTMHRWLS